MAFSLYNVRNCWKRFFSMRTYVLRCEHWREHMFVRRKTKIHWLDKIAGFGKIAASFGVFLYKYTVFRLKDFGKYILEAVQSAESAKVGNIWKYVFQVQNTSRIAMQNPCQDFFHILTGNIWKYGFAHFFIWKNM